MKTFVKREPMSFIGFLFPFAPVLLLAVAEEEAIVEIGLWREE